MQPKGDTMTIDERTSDDKERRFVETQMLAKAQGNRNQVLSKNTSQIQTRKKTVSHYVGITNLDALVNKSTKLQLKTQKEALVTSTDSGLGGTHKKPRQPKQRVGVNSKVSTSENELQRDFVEGKFDTQ
jgi:hypothetical protein